VWQPGWGSRLNAFLKDTLRKISIGRLALAVFVLPLLLYAYREITRDVLIIDPFTVPRHFEEAGLTSVVVANRIGDALRQIEEATQTRMKKDNLTSLRDEGSTPDVEIPGAKLDLKTVVDLARSVFGIYPKHINGDIVVPLDRPTNAASPPTMPQATVTVYVTQGRNRSAAVSMTVASDDVGMLVQRTAETVLGQVNPYVLAAYLEDHRESEKTIEIVQRMIQSPSEDRRHKSAALNLWGNVLSDQKKYDEAIAKYQKAIELDPKDAAPYNGWGNMLYGQKKYDEAIAKYQKAIELDPKSAFAYNNWGNVLYGQKKYDEAIAKYQKSIELDPKSAVPYNGWGVVLSNQEKYDEAIAKYQKSIELDPKDAVPYDGWGVVLSNQEKYDEAIAKYQKSIELDPKDAVPYINWGNVLRAQGKDDAAAEPTHLETKNALHRLSPSREAAAQQRSRRRVGAIRRARRLAEPVPGDFQPAAGAASRWLKATGGADSHGDLHGDLALRLHAADRGGIGFRLRPVDERVEHLGDAGDSGGVAVVWRAMREGDRRSIPKSAYTAA
jgi:tetratricopeptide (TPR) repeat protein